jgi:tetratricopeptide (TPR) repeat protein
MEPAEELREVLRQRREETPLSGRDEWWRMREIRKLVQAGRWERARSTGGRLLATAPLSDNHIWLLGEMGIHAARTGDVQAAREYLQRLETFDLEPIFMVDLEAVVAYKRAEILTALGEKQRAIDVLRRAIAEDKAVFYHLHFESIFSELDSLVGDPAYDRLVAPRG